MTRSVFSSPATAKIRLLPTTKDFGLMHIVIKTTGKGHNSDQWIFNNQQKRELYQQLKRFLDLFAPIQLIVFNIMSNHAHVLLNIPDDYQISSMNCESQEIMDEAMHNFYELYKMLSGKESLTMDEFRTMLIELLQTELDAWNRKNRIPRS